MFKINTIQLQEMVSKSVKGASNNKLIPITGLISIEVKDGVLTLITTDATNYLYVTDVVDGDDFYAVVSASTFSALVARMTCDEIQLEIKDAVLQIKGNGTYKIELPLDENGNPIKYINPVEKFDFASAEEHIIKLSTINTILSSVKPALATTLEVPCYTGYFVSSGVVATDTYKIASLAENLFPTPVLISAETMNLLGIVTDDVTAHISRDQKTIVYTTKNCVIYAPVMEGIDDYAIDAILGLTTLEFDGVCKLSKTVFLQLLDRIALFVNVYDKNGVDITFTADGVVVSSKAGSGTELIPYIDSENQKDFTCSVDVQMLTQQVKAIQSDVLELHYGRDNAIKFVDGDITMVLALLENE